MPVRISVSPMEISGYDLMILYPKPDSTGNFWKLREDGQSDFFDAIFKKNHYKRGVRSTARICLKSGGFTASVRSSDLFGNEFHDFYLGDRNNVQFPQQPSANTYSIRSISTGSSNSSVFSLYHWSSDDELTGLTLDSKRGECDC